MKIEDASEDAEKVPELKKEISNKDQILVEVEKPE